MSYVVHNEPPKQKWRWQKNCCSCLAVKMILGRRGLLPVTFNLLMLQATEHFSGVSEWISSEVNVKTRESNKKICAEQRWTNRQMLLLFSSPAACRRSDRHTHTHSDNTDTQMDKHKITETHDTSNLKYGHKTDSVPNGTLQTTDPIPDHCSTHRGRPAGTSVPPVWGIPLWPLWPTCSLWRWGARSLRSGPPLTSSSLWGSPAEKNKNETSTGSTSSPTAPCHYPHIRS